MKKKFLVFLTIICVLASYSFAWIQKSADKVLVFSKTGGFRHSSIKEGLAAIQKLGAENGFEVEATEDASVFTSENLRKYKTLVFLNPTGSNIFNDDQKAAFKKFMNKGGGFVGIHAAADCSYEWEWYGKLVGGYFKSHPKIQEATLNVVSKAHPATRHLPSVWKHTDEWYNFKDLFKKGEMNVLIEIDENSYKGGENGDFHPIAWYHNYDGGRAFYTALGHTEADYSDPLFLKHVLGGIKYAMGKKK